MQILEGGTKGGVGGVGGEKEIKGMERKKFLGSGNSSLSLSLFVSLQLKVVSDDL